MVRAHPLRFAPFVLALLAFPVLAQESVPQIPVDLEDPPPPPEVPPEPPEPLRHQWVGLAYLHTEYNEGNGGFDAEGAVLDASIAADEHLLLVGSITGSVIDTSRFNISRDIRSVHFRLGAGYRFTAPGHVDVSLLAKAVRAEFRFSGSTEADNGYELSVLGRTRLAENVEGVISADYLNLFEEGAMSFGFSGFYNFTPQYSVGLGYTVGEDLNTYHLAGRTYF